MLLRTRLARLERAAGLDRVTVGEGERQRQQSLDEYLSGIRANYPGIELVTAADTDPATFTRIRMARGEVVWDFGVAMGGEQSATVAAGAEGAWALRLSQRFCDELSLREQGRHPFQLAIAAAVLRAGKDST